MQELDDEKKKLYKTIVASFCVFTRSSSVVYSPSLSRVHVYVVWQNLLFCVIVSEAFFSLWSDSSTKKKTKETTTECSFLFASSLFYDVQIFSLSLSFLSELLMNRWLALASPGYRTRWKRRSTGKSPWWRNPSRTKRRRRTRKAGLARLFRI